MVTNTLLTFTNAWHMEETMHEVGRKVCRYFAGGNLKTLGTHLGQWPAGGVRQGTDDGFHCGVGAAVVARPCCVCVSTVAQSFRFELVR